MVAQHHAITVTVAEIVRDNALTDPAVDYYHLVHCARQIGLKAKLVRLDWAGLTQLKKALPAIIRLSTGASLVLARVVEGPLGVALHDPNAAEGAGISSSTGCASRRCGQAKWFWSAAITT